MLRVVPTRSAGQAKSYYTRSDYYAGEQELPGVWRGRGADRLGLVGLVAKDAFEALCDNRHPETGDRITAAQRANRTVGYDFNFHAPKSLSLLHALTGDPALLRAFQEAVDETLGRIEADARTRVRKGYRQEDRVTGELVWARFDHFTARPVDGLPDPHLHAHAFAFNMTFDPVERAWKAGQFRELKRDAPYYQAAFHATLAANLRRLGLPVERTADGWEVSGFDRATLDKFSRRARQIDAAAHDRGVTDPAAKAELGAKTRQRKAAHLTMTELRARWAERLDDRERAALDRITARREAAVETSLTAPAALDFACRHLFERHSVVRERQLLAETLRAGLGTVSVSAAEAALRRSDVIVRTVGGERLATTRAVLAEEGRLIAFARDGRGRAAPLGPAGFTLPEWLSPGQAAAVAHVLASPDRVILVRGAAGTGKTTLMRAAAEGIARGGHRVFAFAPSAEASRGVLRRDGFADADTVARLLVDPKLQDAVRGQVLWVDEAGLLGSHTAARLFDLAERLDCRVVFSGDRRQHAAVERGAVLRILETQAGLPVAEVTEIRRQSGAYKEAVRHLSEGRPSAGFDALAALGWVKEVGDAERYERLAADYREALAGGATALVVSPTHAEGARATVAVRAALREAGVIGRTDRELPVLVPVDLTEAERGRAERYRPGDVLQFHQNARGYRLGQRVTVGDEYAVPTDQAGRFRVYRPATLAVATGERLRVTRGGATRDGHKLEAGQVVTVAEVTRRGDLRLTNGWLIDRDFGHLTHAYVSTSHAAQGRTVDRVLVAQSAESWGASSAEQFYVSASRGRQRLTVYTDDAAALRAAIGRSDPRPSATELVGAVGLPERVRQRLRRERVARPEPSRSPPSREAREAVRE